MRAGELRHELQLQSKTETRLADGGIDPTWATYATVWGKLDPLMGREFVQGQAVNADLLFEITIRYYSPIPSTANRILHEGRTFHILAVMHVLEREEKIVMRAKEVVG